MLSTPPHVNLPPIASIEDWHVRNTHRAVLTAGMSECDAWALLIPGFTGSKEDFIALPEPLLAGGFGMVTFDQIGQHESAGSDDPEDYALDELARDTAAIIEYAKHRFGRNDEPHVLGHSFGGLVAQQALVAEHLAPQSFIAFCTGPGGLPPERWGALPALVDALPHTDLGELWRRKLELDAESGAPMPPAEVQEFLASRWMRNHPRQLKQFAQILMDQPEFTERLRRVVDSGLRMAVMWGEFDDAWPLSMQQAMADRLGVPGIELPGVGHSPNAEDPAATAAALLRFWHS